MKKLLLVAVVIVLLALPATTVGAQRFAPLSPRLVYSHFYCNGSDTAELHFVLQSATGDLSGTFVQWYATLDGAPISGIAPYTGTTGGVAHYAVDVPVTPGGHEFVILATTYITLDGGAVYLFNPQIVALEACTPLLVIIDEFTAQCAPEGVTVTWVVSTELLVTRYIVARNGDVILNVAATCPGCMTPATYTRTVELPVAQGVYTLIVYNGEEMVDLQETTLGSCIPTAVKVSRFSAR